jgi:regulation of enolase protein 1 (concanavalin A-like superfamily)
MAHFRGLLLAFAVCLLVIPVQADEQATKKVPGWGELIDPDGDCQVAVAKDRVKLTIPGKPHDFAADLKRWNSPHILTPVKGDVIAEVKVSGDLKPAENSTIPGRLAYHGAGLLLVKDRDNYVSLHRGAVFLDNRVRHYANFELRKDGELAISRSEVELDDKDTVLRVERRGDKYYALASHDGLHWKPYDDPITVDFPETIRVGVVAVSSSDQPFRCSLTDFQIFRKANP